MCTCPFIVFNLNLKALARVYSLYKKISEIVFKKIRTPTAHPVLDKVRCFGHRLWNKSLLSHIRCHADHKNNNKVTNKFIYAWKEHEFKIIKKIGTVAKWNIWSLEDLSSQVMKKNHNNCCLFRTTLLRQVSKRIERWVNSTPDMFLILEFSVNLCCSLL